jgi:hypothetical protein
VVAYYQQFSLSLGHDASIYSGWILATVILFLVIYNLRKKIPGLPLGKAAYWLKAHKYIGWLAILIFLAHTSFMIPNGLLEIYLTLNFLAVSVTGIVGEYIARNVPKRLQKFGEPIIFERLYYFMRRLRKEAEEVVIESATVTKSDTISNFYQDRLKSLFAGPANFWLHLSRSNSPLVNIQNNISNVHQYCNQDEQTYLLKLGELARMKNDLDAQYAYRYILKLWLFIHVPLSFSLVILALFHIFSVYVYMGWL